MLLKMFVPTFKFWELLHYHASRTVVCSSLLNLHTRPMEEKGDEFLNREDACHFEMKPE
jgi:hypothetical protein